MRLLWIALVLAAGCKKSEPLEKLPPPDPTAKLDPQPIPPPPPPPPPPSVHHVPVPERLAAFLHTYNRGDGTWIVSFHEDKPARAVTLETAAGVELVGALAETTAYVDGDIGCVSDKILHIQIARQLEHESVRISFDYDCGHLYLSPAGHEGPFVILAPEVIARIDALRGKLLPRP